MSDLCQRVFRAIPPANPCQKHGGNPIYIYDYICVFSSLSNYCFYCQTMYTATVVTCQNIHSDCRYTPQVQQRISLPVRALRVQSNTANVAASQSPERRAWGPAPSANIASFNSCLASIASYIYDCSDKFHCHLDACFDEKMRRA